MTESFNITEEQRNLFFNEVFNIAVKLSNDFQNGLMLAMKEAEERIESTPALQGQICDLVSAFVMCISIQILRNKGMPETVIKVMADNIVMQAFEFADNGEFYKLGEH